MTRKLFGELWEKHRAAWDRFVEETKHQIERIEIPYEGTTLPGYFFRSGPAAEPRRTLIFNNGSDGTVTGAWVQGIADALARGWNAVTFDGPGQNAALVRQHLPFRPDWEKVITPVVDHLLTRPDVEGGQLALLGVSQAGYWVPRSVAFEHRIAAAVADPGVVDIFTTMSRQIPHFLISCPVLVTDPDHEQFWPGQSRELYDKLPAEKALIRFTEEEGADSHCEPAGNGLRGERIFDWLDQHISNR